MLLESFVTHVVEALKNATWQPKPYGHMVIDNFLPDDVATAIEPHLSEAGLQRFIYDSPIEKKEASNQWNQFAPELYATFAAMNHSRITGWMTLITGIQGLFLDAGLHGGGIHRTPTGGRLNLHIDYAIHPKLNAERRLNMIVYLNRDWEEAWGGQLELWYGEEHPEYMFKKIEPSWNRAVIFATGDTSWHGFPAPLTSPPEVVRHSLAMYYCSFVRPGTSERYKAKFVPSREQASDESVKQLCERRADEHLASEAYRV